MKFVTGTLSILQLMCHLGPVWTFWYLSVPISFKINIQVKQKFDEFDVNTAKLRSTTTWTKLSSFFSTPSDSSVSSMTTSTPIVSSTTTDPSVTNSSSSANSTSTTYTKDDSKISVGAAVAIVVGGIVVIGGLVTFCWFGSAAGQRGPQNQASYSSVPV